MERVSYAFRSFFAILFGGSLPADIAQAFGYVKAAPVKVAAPPKPQAGPADGAVQILGILQRDARLIDFLMEDIAAYSDEQVGAAVRDVHAKARESLERYLHLQPVIDALEGTVVQTADLEAAGYRLIGKVPASGQAPSGVLRHKGWRAAKVDLPAAPLGAILAPAELEIE